MRISLIIISKDETPRLRLALCALSRQSVEWGEGAELILVDDGSSRPLEEETRELAAALRCVHLRHERPCGRSASRNHGAQLARGERLVFLDGDVLLSHGALAGHAKLAPAQLGRGAQRHLRSTRFFLDPRTGEPWPGKEERVRSLSPIEPHLLTEAQARGPFEPLLARSEWAIYPGAGPRKLYELEMGALERNSAPGAAWMAAAGHNFSIPRRLFLEANGFDERLSINEHRELALRLTRAGAAVVPVPESISIHVTHREGFRDPLAAGEGSAGDWLALFGQLHPREASVMTRFWRTLARDPALREPERIDSLEAAQHELARASA